MGLPKHRIVDIGFGDGEFLQRLIKLHGNRAVIEGVEHKRQRGKVQVKGAKLDYRGIHRWLSKADNASYSEVHMNLTLQNLVGRKQGVDVNRITENVDVYLKKEHITPIFRKIKTKLLPGGHVHVIEVIPKESFSDMKQFFGGILNYLGYDNIEVRYATSEEIGLTKYSRKENEPEGQILIKIVGRNPA